MGAGSFPIQFLRFIIFTFRNYFTPCKSPSKLSENETVCICKDDLCEGLGQKGCYLCEGGGNHLKYLRRLWIEKKGDNF